MTIKNQYIENLKKEDFSFYGYPIKYTLKDYENILDKIKNKSKKTKEILSIYHFGELKAPGISDIDLIFVLNENCKLPALLKKHYIDNDSKYLIFHPFLIFTENIMENIKYIYPNSKYIRIYGKDICLYEPSKSELKKIKTYLIIDTVLRHFPVDYLYILLSKRVNIRMVLLRFNALKNTLNMFKDISGKEKLSWNNFSKNVGYIRKNWFNLNKDLREYKLLSLAKEAVYISTDFLKEVDIFLSKNEVNIVDVKQDNVLFRGTKNRISFVKDWEAEKSMDQLINHFLSYKNFYSILPISFLKHLCCYSSLNGRLSMYIRKRLNVKCLQNNIEPTLRKRIQILNAQVEYANELKHSHYPCFFPLGYKTEKGFKNKLILLFVIVTSSSIFRRILFYYRGILRKHS